ncbi:MAG TPA: thioesterase family protein [Thermodesulfobacteriota bacterium]|nr:thioesterase family protein [Thermodesulfobacteriota bacterium]
MTDLVDVEIRVRYAETDQMGVAYYANYLVWFEVGRSEFCRERGFRYADLEALGFRLVVSDVHCRYRNPARYDETVVVRTRLKGVNKRMVTFGYQLLRPGQDEVIAEGETRHICIDSSGRTKSLPEKFLACLTG